MTNTLDHRTGSGIGHFSIPNFIFLQQRLKTQILLSLFLCLLLIQTSAAADSTLSYNLSISGLQGNGFDGVRKAFNTTALLKTPRADALVSVTKLRAHIKSDTDLMHRILRAEGYYAGKVSARVARTSNQFDIEFNVAAGARYTFGNIAFEFTGAIPEQHIIEKIKEKTALKPEDPAIAATFIAAEARLDSALQALGFPFAEDIRHDLVVDHQTKLLNVTFFLEPGTRQRMGTVRYTGNGAINEAYLHTFTDWPDDSYFEQRLVTDLRNRLLKSGLFAGVAIKIIPADSNYADLVITLSEAPHRTIGATTEYSTAEGFGAEVFWEHRNMFNRGARLKVTARGAEIEQSIAGRLELPNFARLDQTVSIESRFLRQTTDAFLSYEGEIRAGIDRVITPQLAASVSTALEYSDVTDAAGAREFLLASVSFGARWDSSNDLLNPSRGIRASIMTTPNIDLRGNNLKFLKSEFRASTYYPVTSDHDLIVALRTRIGAITGASNDALPATQRFFAGGGGSIRGFSFQNVGPLDATGAPTGGRSVAEVAGEFRIKLTDTIGIVPFIEGGNTYVSSLPKFSDFRWGIGIGARYYTNFGPIRFDLASPLNRRPGESRLQFYVSLGQAF